MSDVSGGCTEEIKSTVWGEVALQDQEAFHAGELFAAG